MRAPWCLALAAAAAVLGGCHPCEGPVNADLIVHVELAPGVAPKQLLYIASTDRGALLRGPIQLLPDAFPHTEDWQGNCEDHASMPPGVYTVTAWLADEPRDLRMPPLATDPQGTDQVEIVDDGTGRRATSELEITILAP